MSLDEGAPRHTLASLRGRRDTVLGEGPLDGVASEFISEVLECALQARISRRVQKYKRTQDRRAGTFRNRRVYAWLADGS